MIKLYNTINYNLDFKNQHLTNVIAEKDNENSLLQVALKNPKPINTVDLTCESTNEASDISISLNNHSSKRQRTEEDPPKSNLAFAHQKNQAMVRVKEEAQERANISERKATAAEREKEAYDMELECPYFN